MVMIAIVCWRKISLLAFLGFSTFTVLIARMMRGGQVSPLSVVKTELDFPWISDIGLAALSTPSVQVSSNNSTPPLVGFIRIRKTGSTSFLKFLTSSSGLHSWDNFIYSATDYLHATGYSKIHRKIPFCVFGHARQDVVSFRHDPRDGPNPFEYRLSSVHNMCPHATHSDLKKYWRGSLAFSKLSGRDDVLLQPVTMVREPFDRLRSQFYYVKKRCNTTMLWRHMYTKQQYNRLCAGDLDGWVELLHKQGANHNHAIYQYRHLDDDHEKAISLIQGNSPKVYILLSECFEESLRFMEHKFLLKPGAADAHIDSPFYKANANEPAPGELTVSERKLRQKAKRWFKRDYEFYNAAVKQFRHQMASIELDPSTLLNPCDLLL